MTNQHSMATNACVAKTAGLVGAIPYTDLDDGRQYLFQVTPGIKIELALQAASGFLSSLEAQLDEFDDAVLDSPQARKLLAVAEHLLSTAKALVDASIEGMQEAAQ